LLFGLASVRSWPKADHPHFALLKLRTLPSKD
jgi:hypothetical protein